jgi:hypothetical protein
VRGVARRGEESLDQLGAFVGPLVGEELADLGRPRNDAIEVERRAAEELGVVRGGGRLNFGGRPLLS